MTPSTAAEVRALLELSYYAFYAKFPQLTPIQLLSAAPISQGQNCLLTAPTASGKTQAYLAPLVQRYFARLRDQSATVLIGVVVRPSPPSSSPPKLTLAGAPRLASSRRP